jgi:hypothetical protein
VNQFDQMRAAMCDAEAQMRAADDVADQMLGMLLGRLRKCSTYRLKRLKRELQSFNAHTGEWDKKGGKA